MESVWQPKLLPIPTPSKFCSSLKIIIIIIIDIFKMA